MKIRCVKCTVATILTALLAVSAVGMSIAPAFAAETSMVTTTIQENKITPEEPPRNGDTYELSTAGHLYWFAEQINSNTGKSDLNGTLTADIVINDTVLNEDSSLNSGKFEEWNPIKNYSGTFDGNGHTISGFYCNQENNSGVGFFGSIQNGTVRNLGITDSYFNGNHSVGGIVGYNYLGNIQNCYNTGVVTGNNNVGGVVGYHYNPKEAVTDCYNAGIIRGRENVGGVLGYSPEGLIDSCYNTGDVRGSKVIGGVCAYIPNGSVISSYNTGNIHGTETIGGVVGYTYRGKISMVYNTGDIGGMKIVGGICGHNYDGAIADAYSSGTIIGKKYTGGPCGWNTGEITNCYFLSEISTDRFARTAEEFASGEVAYLLNAKSKKTVWFQTIGSELTPHFEGMEVYQVDHYDCPDDTTASIGYSNSNFETRGRKHIPRPLFPDSPPKACSACGLVLSAANSSEENWQQFDLSNAVIEKIESQPYTGKKIVPKLKVTVDSIELFEGVDYRAFGWNNIEPGKATVKIKPMKGSCCTGEKKASFVICPEKVTGLKAVKKTTTSLTLTFNAAYGADGYRIYDAKTGKVLTSVSTQNGAKKIRKTITGLVPGEEGYYMVRAYKIINEKKWYAPYSETYIKATAK